MPLETAGLVVLSVDRDDAASCGGSDIFFAGLAGLVVLLAIVGAIYQSVESSNDLRAHSPPGRLVEVNGYKMHLYCVGDGSPTVILESGLNDSWLYWYKCSLPSRSSHASVRTIAQQSAGVMCSPSRRTVGILHSIYTAY